MAHITNCTQCNKLYEESSEEYANEPGRKCVTCYKTKVLDSAARAAEKEASRAADELAVTNGELTRQQLEDKNIFIRADRTIIHWDHSKKL